MQLPSNRESSATARMAVFPVLAKARPNPRAITTLTDVQRKAHETVLAAPGLTIQEAAKALKVCHATASYHMQCMARFGLIEQVRDGRELRHFPLPRTSIKPAYIDALLRTPKSASLLRFICERPINHMTLNRVARESGLTFGYVRRALFRLHDMELVELTRRNYRYHIAVASELRLLVRGHQKRQET